MVGILFVLKQFVTLSGSRMYSCIIVAVYAAIGGLIYLILTTKLGLFKDIFESSPLDFIKKKIRR